MISYFEKGVRKTNVYKLRKELDYFINHSSWPLLPKKKSIIISDAFYARVAKKRLVIYLTLVRPVNEKVAVILPPTIADGTESYTGRRTHFETIPSRILKRLVAAACDGRVGLIAHIRERDLILQRCHFHLLASLQSKRSKLPQSHHYEEGVRLYRLVKTALVASDSVARSALRKLAIETQRAPRYLRTIISGFLLNYQDYRAYCRYPLLKLPTTTNSVESLIGSVRELLRRLRGIRTRAAFEKWLTGYLKYRRTIKCNSQQNCFLYPDIS